MISIKLYSYLNSNYAVTDTIKINQSMYVQYIYNK